MNFESLLEQHNTAIVHAGQRGGRRGWLNFACPFCGKFPYMGYSLNGGNLTCWQCGRRGLAETIAALTGATPGAAYHIAKTIDRPRWARDEAYTPTGRYAAPPGVGELRPAHRKYLAGRGFDVDVLIRLWELGGIAEMGGRYRWRVFIPILRHGRRCSWTTRSIAPHAAKRYDAAPAAMEAYPAKAWLYGWDYVRHAVICHEGPADVWRTGPGAVATLGVGYSPAQVGLLATAPVRVVCFDNEPEAQRRARALMSALAGFPGRTFNVVLDSNDAASATDKEIAQLRRFLD